MIRLTVIPREGAELFNLLSAKEVTLRKKHQDTLHRSGNRRAGIKRWKHTSYGGRITLQRSIGDTPVAVVESNEPQEEWQLLRSFVGFLDTHFRDRIASITICCDRPAS